MSQRSLYTLGQISPDGPVLAVHCVFSHNLLRGLLVSLLVAHAKLERAVFSLILVSLPPK